MNYCRFAIRILAKSCWCLRAFASIEFVTSNSHTNQNSDTLAQIRKELFAHRELDSALLKEAIFEWQVNVVRYKSGQSSQPRTG